MTNNANLRRPALIVALIGALTLLPFLGLTHFNTKGEPREAVVAQTMLLTGNWTLPLNNGNEFAYKPPLFHWAVAATSSLGGEVTEWTSRFPSALAAIALAVATCLFFSRRRNGTTGFASALIFLTFFEVHRAATACRVDMVLTLFIVLAMMSLFRWAERDLKGWPWLAAVCMGLGVLTKGPVAVIIPCMVSCVLLWTEGRSFFGTLARHALLALCALVIPALWYYAAWRQGGDDFLYRIYEENVLRFIGRMPYHSHEHGPFYNFGTLLSGLLPYTLLALLAAPAALCRRSLRPVFRLRCPAVWKRFAHWFRSLDRTERFTLLAVVLTVAFYTIPKSKRSVYLLPAYPFLAYYIARLADHLSAVRPRLLRGLATLLSVVITTAVVALVLTQTGLASLLPAAWQDAAGPMLAAYADCFGARSGGIALAVTVAAIATWYALNALRRPVAHLIYCTAVVFLMFDAFLLPPALNLKSDKVLAESVGSVAQTGRLYSFVNDRHGMLHYFTLNFYAQNRIKVYREGTEEGFLLVGAKDAEAFAEAHPGLSLQRLKDYGHTSCDTHQRVELWRFSKTNAD